VQGAGGVGGLLAVTDGSGMYTAASDANGNITAYFDDDGEIAAEYDYTPFGSILRSSGEMADDFSYRFSTKPYDAETELYYYGYRYYSPELGRWMSRDPIEEGDGPNIYAFLGNASINQWDYLGLWKATAESAGAARRIYLWEKGDTRETLAAKVNLEFSDFDKWAKPIPSVSASDKKTHCAYSVPNVWISADLLQGGGLWSRFVNIGGTLGRFLGTDMLTWGYKIIKPDYASALLSITKSNAGDIWGMVVFGHGGKNGYLGDYDKTDYIYQSSLISALKKQKFRLAKAFLMQCYSGNNELVNWSKQWHKVAQDPYLYTGQNWLMIDMLF
jgi:RHS repeat-associated protein